LRDGDVGHWKGQDIAALDSAELTTWLTDSASAPHGGESVDRLCARVAQWMQSLQTESGHVVAITHPFVIRAALLYVMQFPVAMFYRIDVGAAVLHGAAFQRRLAPAPGNSRLSA